MGARGCGEEALGAGDDERSLRSRVLQKWQCVEDATGKLQLHKCKGPARLGGRALSNLVPKYYGQGSEACTCNTKDYKLSLAGRRKKFFKKSKCGGLAGRGEIHNQVAHRVAQSKSRELAKRHRADKTDREATALGGDREGRAGLAVT